MLKSIFVDNFRCLENFELKLDRLNLLMGANGSGKSSVFEVLRRLQRFIGGDCRIQEAFPAQDLTRSRAASAQRFKLELETDKLSFRYLLFVQHSEDRTKCWVNEESLHEGKKLLYFFKEGQVTLDYDNRKSGRSYPFERTLPAMAGVPSGPGTRKLTAFRQQLARFVIAGISPTQMESLSQGESPQLSPLMENFVSWYRRVAQENFESVNDVFLALKNALPGFAQFRFTDVGMGKKALNIYFDHGKTKQALRFDFSELSDGQRVLFALYALIHGLRGEGLTLFLDEPDNYVALREIQPWLTELSDLCGEGFEQAVLISHHPEIINYLGNTKGRWFERIGYKVKVSDSPPKAVDGLELAETIVRGWL